MQDTSVAVALVAVATAPIARPVATADTKGTLAMVNGIPGKKVDICLDGNEIKSNVAYGGRVFRNGTGTGIRVQRRPGLWEGSGKYEALRQLM